MKFHLKPSYKVHQKIKSHLSMKCDTLSFTEPTIRHSLSVTVPSSHTSSWSRHKSPRASVIFIRKSSLFCAKVSNFCHDILPVGGSIYNAILTANTTQVTQKQDVVCCQRGSQRKGQHLALDRLLDVAGLVTFSGLPNEHLC